MSKQEETQQEISQAVSEAIDKERSRIVRKIQALESDPTRFNSDHEGKPVGHVFYNKAIRDAAACVSPLTESHGAGQ